jgi:ABC-type oligopeptide transport system ATPase subunit
LRPRPDVLAYRGQVPMVFQNPLMYAVDLLERGPTEEVLHNPVRPYTRRLPSAVLGPPAEMSITWHKRSVAWT